jgi:hypothetical protein
VRSTARARAAAGPALQRPVLGALGNRAILSLWRSGELQRKARVSRPGDPLEHAADRAADAVAAGDRSARSPPSSVPEIQCMPAGDEKLAQALRLAPAPSAPAAADAEAPGAELIGGLSVGRNLDERTRALMEESFGESFGDVRVHTDPRAGEAANTVHARAFTVGEDIVFGEGEFAPETTEGRRLLAHELAHVVQQRRPAGGITKDNQAERDAQDAAREVARGGTPSVRERAAPSSVQKQAADGPAATTKPSVQTSRLPINSESSSVVVAVEEHLIASGRTSSLDHPHDDGGAWDPSTLTLTIRVFLARFGTVSAIDGAGAVVRDLGLSMVVIIPVIDGEAQDSIVIPAAAMPPKPRPAKPPLNPPALTPVVGPPEPDAVARTQTTAQPESKVDAKLRTIRANLESFTFNINWAHEIIAAFRDASPLEFQQLQDGLGEEGMTNVFDQLEPFQATLIGTFGTVMKGRSKLTEQRAEWLLEVSRWGANQKSFMYYWIFQSMPTEDVIALLNYLAATSHLDDTVNKQPGMRDYLAQRGITLGDYTQTPLGFWRAIGRGLKHAGTSLMESSPAVRDSPKFGYDELPEPYRSQFFESAGQNFFKALTPANIVRGAASEVTTGLSEMPFGVWAAGEAVWAAGGDIASGKPGEAAEKLTPAVTSILLMLLTHKLGRLSARGALAVTEEEGALLAPKGVNAGSIPPEWKVVSDKTGSDGFKRVVIAHPSGAMLRLEIDEATVTGRVVNLATGNELHFKNGQFVGQPAGLLPAPGAPAWDPFQSQVSGNAAALPSGITPPSRQMPLRGGFPAPASTLASPSPLLYSGRPAPMLLRTESSPGVVMQDFAVNNMDATAAAYQARAGGLPAGYGYYVNRPGTAIAVQFDGHIGGELIDAKNYLANGSFVKGANDYLQNPNTDFAQRWVTTRIEGENGILAEARRQLAAAGNVPIMWRVASQEATTLIQQIFQANGIAIRVVYYP